jgi:N-acyl-D-aspartate/D-glutamate deacylase
MGAFDLIIRGGLVFDGSGAPAAVRDVGIRGGQITEVAQPSEQLPTDGARLEDATGRWVVPGFIDLHTHYDAEVELAPSLSESLRHGVTTCLVGSCSLSLALGTPEDLADQFCRVEAIPYEVVRPLLERTKRWETVGEYFRHLDATPLGPNLGSFLGHSAMRAHVMGLERSLDKKVRPSRQELERMDAILGDALDEGYLGLSINTLTWDKIGGQRHLRSRPLPSTFAPWSEYRRFNRILRRRGRIFQGVPNISTKVNVLLFLWESVGLLRPALKTTVIALMDPRADRIIHRLAAMLTRIANVVLRADFRLQALPEIFDLWADGIDLVVFEEFGAGVAALHLEDELDRRKLLTDPDYRTRFRREWTSRFLPRAFHRDFKQSEILACPDPTVVGKSFAQAARERDLDPVDLFLDLVAEHGTRLRWYTVMANDRQGPLDWIVQHPDILIGFSDAGAHLRQMAHYNFPLRLLNRVKKAHQEGRRMMSMERAVQRATGELGDWLGIEAGRIQKGRQADVVILDPDGIDDEVEGVTEAEIEGFPGSFKRLVRRNDKAVKAVFVRGQEAVRDGQVLPAVGKEPRFGRVLRAAG